MKNQERGIELDSWRTSFERRANLGEEALFELEQGTHQTRGADVNVQHSREWREAEQMAEKVEERQHGDSQARAQTGRTQSPRAFISHRSQTSPGLLRCLQRLPSLKSKYVEEESSGLSAAAMSKLVFTGSKQW